MKRSRMKRRDAQHTTGQVVLTAAGKIEPGSEWGGGAGRGEEALWTPYLKVSTVDKLPVASKLPLGSWVTSLPIRKAMGADVCDSYENRAEHWTARLWPRNYKLMVPSRTVRSTWQFQEFMKLSLLSFPFLFPLSDPQMYTVDSFCSERKSFSFLNFNRFHNKSCLLVVVVVVIAFCIGTAI